MTNKRITPKAVKPVVLPDIAVEPEAVVVAEDIPVAAAIAEDAYDFGYTVGDWKGRPQYKCNYCEVDFIDNETMIKAHVGACPKRIRGEQ